MKLVFGLVSIQTKFICFDRNRFSFNNLFNMNSNDIESIF